MPTLQWLGKEKVITHHLAVPFCFLEKKYTYQDSMSVEGESENKIIQGDNLLALKSLLPEYTGKIKCIYIDPPYNTGNEGWIYNDNVNDPKIKKWLGQVVGKEGEDLSRHDKWLCMMYPRLTLLQRLLADDGAIFISIDDNEQANLRLICDEIFGSHCFITDLIWRSADSSNNDAKQFSTDYNHTLIYSKQPNWQPQKFDRKEENNLHYKNPDNDPRGPWFSGNVSSPNPRENLKYDIISPNGTIISSPKNGWRWSKERMEEMITNKMVIFSPDQTRIIKKTYLCDQAGITPSNIWWDVEDSGHNRNAKYELLKIFSEHKSADVFKTPKPTKFLEKILRLFPDKDSIILDSFAGSGTTAHAVLNLNQQDGGNRKFILIEMEDYAESITAERVRRVIDGYGNIPGAGGCFSFYTLGEPLFDQESNISAKVTEDKLRTYVYFMETRQRLPKRDKQNPYLLGIHEDTAYYFFYKQAAATTLSTAIIGTIPPCASRYVIYASRCTLSREELGQRNITFKKIPRDISRL